MVFYGYLVIGNGDCMISSIKSIRLDFMQTAEVLSTLKGQMAPTNMFGDILDCITNDDVPLPVFRYPWRDV